MNKLLLLAVVSPLGIITAMFAFLLCSGPTLLVPTSYGGIPEATSSPSTGSPVPGDPTLLLPNGGKDGLPKGFTLPAGTPREVVLAIDFATSKLGMPYQYGGEGNPSYDCSGLMQAAWSAAGVHIARTTYDQVNDGIRETLATIEPGDLILIPGSDGTMQSPGHVGMYLGQNLVIQSPHTGTYIKVTALDGGASFGPIAAIRRIDVNGM